MTLLSGVPAPGRDDAALLTVQCDVCCPPFLATNRLDVLQDAGWTTTLRGGSLDICHLCNRRLLPGKRVPRSVVPRLDGAPGALPSLVVVGAAKCATNSLHAYLDAHPEISMSGIEEPQFFQDPDGDAWIELYRSYFDPAAKVTGESSTAYTRYPVVPGVPERMADLIPGARIVYMVRDPIERAVSSYVEERMNDNDHRSFEEAFEDLADPLNPYVAASRYATQLSRYLQVFPRDQILVVDMDDLEQQPDETMRRIYGFLDVDPDFEVRVLGARLNTREHKREYSPGIRRLRASPLLRLAYLLPAERRERLLEPMRRRLSRGISRPQLTDGLRQRLQAVLAPEAEKLRELTGQSFSGWSV